MLLLDRRGKTIRAFTQLGIGLRSRDNAQEVSLRGKDVIEYWIESPPKTLTGSFPSVSTPIFATKYAFFRIFRDLQDSETFARLHTQNFAKFWHYFSKFSENFDKFWQMEIFNFHCENDLIFKMKSFNFPFNFHRAALFSPTSHRDPWSDCS